MKPIKINKDKIYYRIGYRTLIYERTIDEFMGFNPPCKDCLVQAVCVENARPMYIEYEDAAHEEFLLIRIRGCEDLKKFIIDNPAFWVYMDEPLRRRSNNGRSL